MTIFYYVDRDYFLLNFTPYLGWYQLKLMLECNVVDLRFSLTFRSILA